MAEKEGSEGSANTVNSHETDPSAGNVAVLKEEAKNKNKSAKNTTSSDDGGASQTQQGISEKEILKPLSEFVGVVDRKGSVQFATETPILALGYDEEDVLRKPFWKASWFAPSRKSQDTIKRNLGVALKGQRVRCRVDAFDKEGTSVSVGFIMSPLKHKDGSIVGIVADKDPLPQEPPKVDQSSTQIMLGESLMSALELSQQGYFKTDNVDRLKWMSPSAAKLLGYKSRDALIGKRMDELWVHAEQYDEFIRMISNKGKVEGYETALSRKDSSELAVEIDARNMRSLKGELQGTEVVFKDISGRKMAQDKQRDAEGFDDSEDALSIPLSSQEIYSRVAEEINQGVMIVKHSSLELVNQRFFDMSGYTSEDLYMMATREGGVKELLISLAGTSNSAAEATLWEKHQQSLAGNDISTPIELDLIRKDGTTLSCEFVTSLIEFGGEPADLIMIHDVSNRKSLESELFETNNRYWAIFDNPLLAVYINDLEGHFVEINEYGLGLLEYNADESVSLEYKDVIHPDDLPNAVASLEQIAAGETVPPIEFRLLTKSGDIVWVSTVIMPLAREGENYAVLGFAQDITELKSQEQESTTPQQAIVIPDNQFQADEQMQVIMDQLKASEDKLNTSEEQVQAAEEQIKSLEEQLKASEYKLNTSEEQVQVAEEQIKSLEEQLKASEDKLNTSEEQVQVAEEQIKSFEEQLSTAVDQLNASEEQMKEAEEQIKSLEEQLSTAVDQQQAGTNDSTTHDNELVTLKEKLKGTELLLSIEGEQLEAVLNNIQDAYIKLDESGNILLANQRALRFAGCESMDQLQSTKLEELFNPEDYSKLIEELLHTGASQGRELILVGKDGKSLPVELNVQATSVSDGGAVAFEGTMRDISDRKNAEEAILESTGQYKAIVENMWDAYFRVDEFGNILLANPRALELSGCSEPEEMLSIGAQGFLHAREYALIMNNLVKKGLVERREITIHRKDGKALPVEFNARLVPGIEGSPRIFEGTVRDISDRKRAEEAILDRERQFRAILENMQDAYLRVDETGMVLMANPRAVEICGCSSSEEMLSLRMKELLYAGDYATIMNSLARTGKVNGEEVVIQRKDGGLVCVEFNARLVPTAEGKPMVFEGTARDVSERKLAEKRRIEAEMRYETIFHNPLLSVYIIDLQGRFIDTNDRLLELMGYSQEELQAIVLQDTIHPDDLSLIYGSLEQVAEGVNTPIEECRLINKSGEVVWIDMLMMPLVREDEVVYATLGFAQDINERKLAETSMSTTLVNDGEDRYGAIFNSPAQAIFVSDLQGFFIDANPSGLHLIECTTDELQNLAYNEIVYPDDYSKVFECMREVATSGWMSPIEIRLCVKSGDVIWVSVLMVPLAQYGEIYALMSFIQDITERKQYELDLYESEEYFRMLVENTPDAIAVINGDGTIRYGNPSIEQVLGYQAEEIVGLTISDHVHPDDLPSINKLFETFIDNPEVIEAVEARYQHGDGSWHWIEVKGLNLLDEPMLQGFILQYHDVTRHRLVEEDLRKSEERLRELVLSLRESQDELVAPTIQIWDGVLALPLIGYVDDLRAEYIAQVLTDKIVATQSETVIIDVTDMPSIETLLTGHLLQIIRSTSLLGAQCILSGVRQEEVQSVVGLHAGLRGVVLRRSLPDALKYVLKNRRRTG
ncbi:MAG: PAS domain S-box protein [Chloroflexota bacterium]|nr:PAS domain S-box protein [Chloroflexota bacterium]